MTTATAFMWSLSALALSLSTCALIVAVRSSARSQSLRLNALLRQLSDHSEALEALSIRLRTIQTRLNMAAGRARRANGETSEAPPAHAAMTEDEKDKWQRETNLKIARGEIHSPLHRR